MPPRPVDFAARWREVREEIMAGVEAWRVRHPQATLGEIEAAVDERFAELRACMRQDVALASQAADVSHTTGQGRPVGPRGGTLVKPRRRRERQVTTHPGKTLRLRRRYGRCPTGQVEGFSP